MKIQLPGVHPPPRDSRKCPAQWVDLLQWGTHSPTVRGTPTVHGLWEALRCGQGSISLEYQTYNSPHPFDTFVTGMPHPAPPRWKNLRPRNPDLYNHKKQTTKQTSLGNVHCCKDKYNVKDLYFWFRYFLWRNSIIILWRNLRTAINVFNWTLYEPFMQGILSLYESDIGFKKGDETLSFFF